MVTKATSVTKAKRKAKEEKVEPIRKIIAKAEAFHATGRGQLSRSDVRQLCAHIAKLEER